MNNFLIKSITPHIIAIIIFIAIPFAYFTPLLEGKMIKQQDIDNFKGSAEEIINYREKTGDEPLWTNSMFGGMPAYHISTLYKANLIKYVDRIFRLGLPTPAFFVFLYLIGFYILLLTLRIEPWLAIIGAIAFAFSSYFFVIIEAGHNSKAVAIAYMPTVLAGIILTFRGKYLLGGILTALFLALELKSGHLQITYYLMFVIIIYSFFKLINIIKNKYWQHLYRVSGVLIIAILLAVGSHFANIWTTLSYSKYTTRGPSDLTFDKSNKTSGLDRDYVIQWSYGIGETMSLLIPNFKGGGSGYLAQHKEVLKDIDPQLRQAVGSVNSYWGNQPFTSGPVYLGALVCFLFVLGLFIVKGQWRWIVLTATILSIMLSWGKNFMPFTNFFLDYVPGYNKFRSVSMALVIVELVVPILAIITISKIIQQPEIIRQKKKHFLIALGITGGIALLLYIMPTTFTDFFSVGEYEDLTQQLQKNKWPNGQISLFLDGVEQARISLLKGDAIRTLIFILLGATLIWLFSKSIVKKEILIGGLFVLIIGDMWMVNKRYLNDENFISKSKAEIPFHPTQADSEILKDKDPNFRVLNVAVNTFNDASTSYFHKSIGGYHGAKLKRYQELIEYQISKQNRDVLNMLNTKYFIVPNNEGKPQAVSNPDALGNAWFVREFKLVDNADSEITALSNFNPSTTAIVDKRFKSDLDGFNTTFDSTAQIQLTQYQPNYLNYQTNANTEQLAVFSEVYFKDGWNAYVDGILTPYFSANYVLRAMRIPSGEHKIEFKFEPKPYIIGERISLISSALLLLLFVGITYREIKLKVQEPK